MSRPTYSSQTQGSLKPLVLELIRARELLVSLVSKDIRVQYRFAVFGYLWAVIEPLIMTLVLTFVFTVVFPLRVHEGMEGRGHFVVMLLCAYLFWRFFADSVSGGSRSLVENASLIKKVNFPREIIPLSVIGRSFVNLAIGFAIFLVIHLLLGGRITLSYLWAAPVIAILVALVVGLNLLFSTFHATFRDVGYIVNVGLVFGFYATPIFYTLDDVGESRWAALALMANPMTGILGSLQTVFVDNAPPSAVMLAWPAFAAAAVLAVGVVVFRRRSGTISDYL